MNSPIFLVLKRLRYPLILLISIYSILILGFTLIPGQDDQGNTWYMSFFHAFYFVSFMGSTIGFGEIPYAFNEAQRAWAIVGIFFSVIAWLYSIGTLLKILRDPTFQKVLTQSAFENSVNRLNFPFYIICGYGDTGSVLAHELASLDIQTVVLDWKQERIDYLDIDEPDMDIPAFCADASIPDNLLSAGLTHPKCVGVISLTDDDQTNLKISIAVKLLNKNVQLISRAETMEAADNMASFDTDHIINPYEVFAKRLALAIRSPGAFLIYDWFTSPDSTLREEPLDPPKGWWVVCGYGRFGKAVDRYLRYEGIRTVIVEAFPEYNAAPKSVITGSGTEAITLKDAGIGKAVGIVAGTDNDANNLSIIVTAHELKVGKTLFSVARQNNESNSKIFEAADLSMIMQPACIIAREILALIKSPLLAEFLSLVRRQKRSWVNILISRVSGLYETENLNTWTIKVNDMDSRMIREILAVGDINVADMMRNPRDRQLQLNCIPLLIKHKKQFRLLPETQDSLSNGDEILFCGDHDSMHLMHWSMSNVNAFQYIACGEEYFSGYLWKFFK